VIVNAKARLNIKQKIKFIVLKIINLLRNKNLPSILNKIETSKSMMP